MNSNSDTSLISIVIPTLNRAHCLGTALDSLINQTYSQWECIIVDDGSNDNTEDLVKEYAINNPNIRFIKRTSEVKGAASCRNIGIKNSRSEFIIFLDSDDYLLPHCIEQRINQFKLNPDCDFLVFPMDKMFANKTKRIEIPKNVEYLDEFLSANILWQTSCPIWKKSMLMRLDGFNEEYSRFNDPELMIRAFLEDGVNYKICHNAPSDLVHISGSVSLSNELYEAVYSSLIIFMKDVKELLIERNSQDKIKLLSGYLYFWFRYVYSLRNEFRFRKAIDLLGHFRRLGIIQTSKYINLSLRLALYVASGYVLGKPINKLKYKSLYLTIGYIQ